MSEDIVVNNKLEWSSQAVLNLIELFQNEQCLYNTKSSLYHNKHARAEALEGMAQKMAGTLPGITATEVRTKLNYLRSQYARELCRQTESKKSGAGTDEVYVPSAYWFDHLHFIRDFVRVRKGKSNIFQNLDDISLSESDDLPSSSNRMKAKNDASFTDVTPAKKKKSNSTEADEALKMATGFLQKMSEDDSKDKFTQGLISFISSSLIEIQNKNLRDEVSSKIMLLLFEYMKKQRQLEAV